MCTTAMTDDPPPFGPTDSRSLVSFDGPYSEIPNCNKDNNPPKIRTKPPEKHVP